MLDSRQKTAIQDLERKLVSNLLRQFDYITYITPRRLEMSDLELVIKQAFND